MRPHEHIERLLADPGKAPRVFGSAEAFIDALLVGKHVDELLVLRDGLSKLGLANAFRRDVLSAVERSRSIPEFASRVGAHELEQLDGRVYFWQEGRESTLKRDRDGNLYSSVAEKLCAAAELAAEDAKPAPTPEEGAAAGLRATGGLYIAELARRRRRQHPCCPGERSRTLATCDVQDVMPFSSGRLLPSWDRGHAFVGGSGAGSSVHVDQVNWSNVGKNFAGSKAVAIWPVGRETHRILERWYRSFILRPDPATGDLPAEAAADLEKACKVAVVGPGDVFVFSGANAHTTFVMPERASHAPSLPLATAPPPRQRAGGRQHSGRAIAGSRAQQAPQQQLAPTSPRSAAAERRSGCLSLTAFESFVNFNQDNLRTFLLTGTKHGHYPPCAMLPGDLADFKWDIADRLHSALEWVRGCGPDEQPAPPEERSARPRSRSLAPPPPRATRAGQALAERMRGAVLAAAELLRTDPDVDERMRRLEGRARTEAEREESSDGSDGAHARYQPPPEPAGRPADSEAALGGCGSQACSVGSHALDPEHGKLDMHRLLPTARYHGGADEVDASGPWTH